MIYYNVMHGEYPFDQPLGQVLVSQQEDKEKEAASALYQAKEVFGGHPVVYPA